MAQKTPSPKKSPAIRLDAHFGDHIPAPTGSAMSPIKSTLELAGTSDVDDLARFEAGAYGPIGPGSRREISVPATGQVDAANAVAAQITLGSSLFPTDDFISPIVERDTLPYTRPLPDSPLFSEESPMTSSVWQAIHRPVGFVNPADVIVPPRRPWKELDPSLPLAPGSPSCSASGSTPSTVAPPRRPQLPCTPRPARLRPRGTPKESIARTGQGEEKGRRITAYL
jgi:hypothetical protein